MRAGCLLLAALLFTPAAFAQTVQLDAAPSSYAAQTGGQAVSTQSSYMISDGVSVTPLYDGAQNSISTYTPEATQADYSQATYQQAPSSASGNTASYPQYSSQQYNYSQTGAPQVLGYGSIQPVAYASTQYVGGAQGVDAGGYVPRTPYDNTPYRFNMQQNGKQMSAEDFEAWMKSRGIRIAGGRH